MIFRVLDGLPFAAIKSIEWRGASNFYSMTVSDSPMPDHFFSMRSIHDTRICISGVAAVPNSVRTTLQQAVAAQWFWQQSVKWRTRSRSSRGCIRVFGMWRDSPASGDSQGLRRIKFSLVSAGFSRIACELAASNRGCRRQIARTPLRFNHG